MYRDIDISGYSQIHPGYSRIYLKYIWIYPDTSGIYPDTSGYIQIHPGCIWIHPGYIWIHLGYIWIHLGYIKIYPDIPISRYIWIYLDISKARGRGVQGNESHPVPNMFSEVFLKRCFNNTIICHGSFKIDLATKLPINQLNDQPFNQQNQPSK
jgi:hypothetical protein